MVLTASVCDPVNIEDMAYALAALRSEIDTRFNPFYKMAIALGTFEQNNDPESRVKIWTERKEISDLKFKMIHAEKVADGVDYQWRG